MVREQIINRFENVQDMAALLQTTKMIQIFREIFNGGKHHGGVEEHAVSLRKT